MFFDFVSLRKQEIDKEINGIHINAVLIKKSSLVDFKATIKGDIALTCDRCLSDCEINKTLQCDFKISNRSCEDDEVMYEFTDNKIDIDFIIESEINAIKSDYFICEKCNDDDEFEFNLI